MKGVVDIDELYMSADKTGTVTLPIQVTGHWKLRTRIWVGTKLILLAALVLNLGVEVEHGDE